MESCPTNASWSAVEAAAAAGGGGLGAALLATLLTTLAGAPARMRAEAGYPPDAADRLLPEYDFVVVGGGSAGSAVAARLAEVAEWRVLLLEAGADPPLSADIPPLFHSLQESEVDWGYETEPQEAACLGMEGRRCYWPRGKVLGGSSVLNAMLHVRGNPRDYDAWEAAGNPGWAYRHVRPYFIKAESFEMPQEPNPWGDYSAPEHGSSGPLRLTQRAWRSPLCGAVVRAARQLGLRVGDASGGRQAGFTLQHVAVAGGVRQSAARAYLSPAAARRNLHVARRAAATAVLVHPGTLVANGVRFLLAGRNLTVRAAKEMRSQAPRSLGRSAIRCTALPLWMLQLHRLPYYVSIPDNKFQFVRRAIAVLFIASVYIVTVGEGGAVRRHGGVGPAADGFRDRTAPPPAVPGDPRGAGPAGGGEPARPHAAGGAHLPLQQVPPAGAHCLPVDGRHLRILRAPHWTTCQLGPPSSAGFHQDEVRRSPGRLPRRAVPAHPLPTQGLRDSGARLQGDALPSRGARGGVRAAGVSVRDLRAAGGAAAAAQPRLHQAALGRPAGAACHRPPVPHTPARRRRARRGRQVQRPHGQDQGSRQGLRGGDEPRGSARVRAPRLGDGRALGVRRAHARHDHLPPGGHVQDGPRLRPGRRGGRAPQGARAARAARRRRLRHADHRLRQHQRPRRHDRREGRRHDQAGLGGHRRLSNARPCTPVVSRSAHTSRVLYSYDDAFALLPLDASSFTRNY